MGCGSHDRAGDWRVRLPWACAGASPGVGRGGCPRHQPNAKTRFALHGLRWKDFDLSRFADDVDLLNGISVVYHLAWSPFH